MKRFSVNTIFIVLFFATGIVVAKAQDTLSPVQFQQETDNTSGAVLVDVRTPGEYAEGHLENARNIDWKSPDFTQRMEAFGHDTPLYLYCLAGGRSDAAARQLKKQGFTHVKQLGGGYLAW